MGVEIRMILLIAPKFSDWESLNKPNFPTGLLYLGSYLSKNGIETVVIDSNNWTNEKLFFILDKYLKKCTLVGISAMTSQIQDGLLIAKYIRQYNKEIKIVWGGSHPTLFPEQTILNEYVDIVVCGEGETTISEIYHQKPLENINGICYKKNGKIYKTNEREYIDLNITPTIDFNILHYIKENPDLTKIKTRFPLMTSRGCPYNCSFCITKGKKYRSRDGELVINDIRQYVKWGIKRITFWDDAFFINKKRTIQILNAIIEEKLDIEWLAMSRASDIRLGLINDETLKLMKKSGCYKIIIGAESGSQRILDMLNKQITVNDILFSAKKFNEHDIVLACNFMMGMPHEKLEDIQKTLQLIVNLVENNSKIHIFGAAIYRPYPGSELYEKIKSEYLIKFPETLEDWANSKFLVGERYNIIDYPYISVNLKLLERIKFYASNSNGFIPVEQYKKSNAFKKIINNILKSISLFRIKNSFFNFPVSYFMYMLYYNHKIKNYNKTNQNTG